MNEVSYSHKVSDVGLTSSAIQSQGTNHTRNECVFTTFPLVSSVVFSGKLVAIGDADGSVTLLELCEELYAPGNNEKLVVGNMLERFKKNDYFFKNVDLYT